MPTLDTVFLIDLINHKPAALAKLLDLEGNGAPLAITPINALELFKGAYSSESVDNNLRDVRAILERVTELPLNEESYDMFGRIAAHLRRQGKPIGDFDEVIAAITLCNDGVIVTRDEHFSRVPDLTVISY
jgi:predicted nucleic acid-binding protein